MIKIIFQCDHCNATHEVDGKNIHDLIDLTFSYDLYAKCPSCKQIELVDDDSESALERVKRHLNV